MTVRRREEGLAGRVGPTSETQADSSALIGRALLLSWLSVVWAVVSGTASVILGLRDHSLAIVGVGLNLLGDLLGSLALIRRFAQARRGAHHQHRSENVARLVVAGSLAVVALFLTVQSIHRLAERAGPSPEVTAVLVAAASVVVLAPLGQAKRRVGASVGSRALRGDGTLSGVGAAVAALALVGLLLDRMLGWWWADSAAALVVGVVAAVEAALLLTVAPRHVRTSARDAKPSAGGGQASGRR